MYILFLIPQYLCSFRRKRRILANQLRGNLLAEHRENRQRGNNGDGNDGGYDVPEQRENQQRGNDGEGNNGGYELDPQAEQRDNNRDGNDGRFEVVPPAELRKNRQRGNNRDGSDGAYEFDPLAEQRGNNRDGNDGGDEAVALAQELRENQQRGNNKDGSDGAYEFDPQAEQKGNQQRGNNGEGNNDRQRIVFDKDFNSSQVSIHGVNQDIVDNRKREHLGRQRSAAGNKDMSFPQGLAMLQDTSIGAMKNLNIPGNQRRGNCDEQGCEVTHENQVAHENDNQRLEEARESATARYPIENDEDVSGTYTNPVQCTDDINRNANEKN